MAPCLPDTCYPDADPTKVLNLFNTRTYVFEVLDVLSVIGTNQMFFIDTC